MTSSDNTDLSLFVSKGTKDCYDEVAEMLEHPAKDELTRFLIIGNPGIGKTRSIMYLLRCILVAHCEKHTKAKTLKHNTLVAVVEDQESKEVCGVVWCGDTGGGTRGWRVCKCVHRSFDVEMCGGLKHKDTVYIVNSGNIGIHEPARTMARTVYVCSPNPKNFNNFQRISLVFLMPMWELQELLGAHEDGLGSSELTFNGVTAADCKCTDVKQFHREVIKYRFDRVGGAVRYVLLDEKIFRNRAFNVETSLGSIDPLGVLLDVKFPGTLVRFLPNSDGSFTSVLSKHDRLSEMEATELVLAKARRTKFLSRYAEDAFFTRCHNNLIKHFDCSPHYAAIMGQAFEDFVMKLMELSAQRTATLKWMESEDAKSSSVPTTAVLSVPLGCTRVNSENPFVDLLKLPLVEDLGKKNQTRKFIVPTSHTNPLFDMADARNRLYQCTLSQHGHSYEAEYLLRALFVANHDLLVQYSTLADAATKCQKFLKNISASRDSSGPFSELTAYICALFKGVPRTKKLRPVHFVWVVPHDEKTRKTKFFEHKETIQKDAKMKRGAKGGQKMKRGAKGGTRHGKYASTNPIIIPHLVRIQDYVFQYTWYTGLPDAKDGYKTNLPLSKGPQLPPK